MKSKFKPPFIVILLNVNYILFVHKITLLIQYKNGEDEKPRIDDLLVFTDTTYGHIVIVSEVGDNFIEVIQQNMGSSARDRFELTYNEGKYFVDGKRVPAGWLRKV